MKPSSKPSPAVFLEAAHRIHTVSERGNPDNVVFCCTEIDGIAGIASPDLAFFTEMFCPKGTCGVWWKRLPDGSFDYESRILALLLCVEMLKD